MARKINLKRKIKSRGEAQSQAIDFQRWASEQSLSYGELAEYQAHFQKLAKKYKLTDEFRENAII